MFQKETMYCSTLVVNIEPLNRSCSKNGSVSSFIVYHIPSLVATPQLDP